MAPLLEGGGRGEVDLEDGGGSPGARGRRVGNLDRCETKRCLSLPSVGTARAGSDLEGGGRSILGTVGGDGQDSCGPGQADTGRQAGRQVGAGRLARARPGVATADYTVGTVPSPSSVAALRYDAH